MGPSLKSRRACADEASGETVEETGGLSLAA